nr:MAG TPA: hypothetical protein [Crassvirales sp.]
MKVEENKMALVSLIQQLYLLFFHIFFLSLIPIMLSYSYLSSSSSSSS